MQDPHIAAASARAAASPAGTTLDGDARELLQTRTATFSWVLAVVAGGFLIYRLLDLIFGHHGEYLHEMPSLVPHGLAVMMLVVMWRLTRRGVRSSRFTRRLEAGGFVLVCIAYAAMGPSIPIYIKPEMIVLLAMTLTIFGRAAYIPSSGERTAWLGAIAAVPLLSSVALTYHLGFVPEQWRAVDAGFAALDKSAVVVGRTVNAAVWWLASVTIATLTSRALYGLRRDIRQVQRLGRYELQERLGEGGMGEVYRAHHALLERPTAVKLLPLDASSARSLQFEREVQLTAQLRHPNTVTIFDYGRTADGVFYYAMELVDGLTLEELVDVGGALPVARALHLLRQATGALIEAHGVGLIHRDIKPANIMVSLPHHHGGVNEVAKVLDFGLARDIRALDSEGSQVDTLRGTPLYMAPEAIKAPGSVDARSDLYALGAVAWYLLTGDSVFTGATIIEVCSKHLYESPDEGRLRAVGAPQALERLILTCLSKAPDERPPSAVEVLAVLDTLAEDHPWTPEDAASWWREHDQDAERIHHRSRLPTSGVRTIDVATAHLEGARAAR